VIAVPVEDLLALSSVHDPGYRPALDAALGVCLPGTRE
jgi:hypothetical protein